jgi:hypothetical protein
MKYKNSQVRDFLRLISDKTQYYASTSEKALLRNYDACDDLILSDRLIATVWDFLKEKFSSLNEITKDELPVSILHTNAGAGRFLEQSPANVQITAYNNDYLCRQICDLLNARSAGEYFYQSEVFDISHFFIGGCTGNIKKYDVVVTQPDEENYYYRGIDTTKVAKHNPVEYYSLRGLEFVTKGGYLCLLASQESLEFVKRNTKILEMASVLEEISSSAGFDQYRCLILKKK